MHKDKLSQDFYSHSFFFKHLAEIVMNLQKCVFLWQILRFEYQIPAKLFLFYKMRFLISENKTSKPKLHNYVGIVGFFPERR